MSSWTLGAVGDVFLDCQDAESILAEAMPRLREVDLLFGNCEGAYTDTPRFAPSSEWRVYAGTEKAAPLGEAGFHVMSCANNHAVDTGHEGLRDTIRVLRDLGIAPVGAGDDLDAALEPVIFERGGVKIAVIAFTSVYQAGYQARAGVPGVAAIRIHSHYYMADWNSYGHVEPGIRPQVRTFPWPEDLDLLKASVESARSRADVVVATFHWGTSDSPGVLTDYERALGHAAIDWGADVVLGHHHHFLRPIEIHNGKPIFYGLGHFAFVNEMLVSRIDPEALRELKAELGEYAVYPREDCPLVPFHPDSRMTMLATCRFEGARLVETGFVPCLINAEGQPVPVAPASAEGVQIRDYLEGISRLSGIETAYCAADGRFIIARGERDNG